MISVIKKSDVLICTLAMGIVLGLCYQGVIALVTREQARFITVQ